MTDNKMPALSPAETEVVRLIWQLGKASVQDVCDGLPEDRDVAYATVQTLLRRLEKKGYITHELVGKAHIFEAAVDREDVVRRTVSDFVDRLFGGDAAPLMMHLAKSGEIKPDDIERLKRLIDDERGE